MKPPRNRERIHAPVSTQVHAPHAEDAQQEPRSYHSEVVDHSKVLHRRLLLFSRHFFGVRMRRAMPLLSLSLAPLPRRRPTAWLSQGSSLCVPRRFSPLRQVSNRTSGNDASREVKSRTRKFRAPTDRALPGKVARARGAPAHVVEPAQITTTLNHNSARCRVCSRAPMTNLTHHSL